MTEWRGIKVGGLYKQSPAASLMEGYIPRAQHVVVVGIEPPEHQARRLDGSLWSQAVVTLLTPEGAVRAQTGGLKELGPIDAPVVGVTFNGVDGWEDEWNCYVEVV